MKFPDLQFEEVLWKDGFEIIGIDEVGRGAFAGPVGVGAVSFGLDLSKKDKEYLMSLGINDSKKLSPKKRLELSKILKQICRFEVVFIDVATINDVGIGQATFLGMNLAVNNLIQNLKPNTYKIKPYLLVDAFEIPGLNIPQKGIKFGDSLSISIAAASILAKVERDRLMEELGLAFSVYQWNKNKGYGTKAHREALQNLGLTQHHRTEFCKKSLLFVV